MDSLTTNGLIAFCDKDDELLKDYLIQNKINGRKFQVLEELDFPEPIRIEVRLLRRAFEKAEAKCKLHVPHPSLNYYTIRNKTMEQDHVLPSNKWKNQTIIQIH